MNNQSSPPKFFLRIFRWFCRQDYLEEIEGDMEERFRDNQAEYGSQEARRLYAWDSIKLLRPILLKKLSGDTRLNNYGMFRNYLKTSVRSIRRNALFSGINVIGLAISMSVGVLMILFLSEIYSFDQFHEKRNKIYRVTSTNDFRGEEHNWATTSIFMADQLAEQVPGIEDLVIMRLGLSADVKTKSDFINISGFYTSPSFFDVFSFDLKKGNPATALSGPSSIVLTESVAEKLFGEVNPLGKLLDLESTGGWQNRTVNGIITGIVEDPPINSHIQFEALVSLKTYEQPAQGPGWRSNFRTNPQDFQTNFVYLTLNAKTKKEEVEYKMDEIISKQYPGEQNPVTHRLQSLNSCATNDLYMNLPGPTFSQHKIYVMIGLTLIVILSACFNYTNLSMARSLRRIKEVGIRKVNGASRYQVFGQFIAEATILSICALILGLVLFFIIKPGFLNLPNPAAQGHPMFRLDIRYTHLLWFFALPVTIGCIAGFLPALFLSKLKALRAFHPQGKGGIYAGLNVRKGLTVFQFTFSIGLIMCSLLIYKQYQFAMNYELGYDTENIVNVHVKGDYAEVLENNYAAIPEVVETSRSKRTLGYSAVFGTAESEDKSRTIRFLVNEIDHNYLDMHDFKLLAGSKFRKQLAKNEDREHIIVNEEFLEALDLESPEGAIGQHVWYNDQKLAIIGVVENFVTTSLVWQVDKKFGFVQSALDDSGILGVKLQGNNKLATLEKLEQKFKELDPDHPFEADFYDDLLAISYREYKSMYTIISFLAFLAVSISTLGLLGMAVFTVETRMKEISIRKVLGAGISNLLVLLSRSFFVMVIIAAIIAIPVTLYLVDNFILRQFLYTIEIGLVETLLGFVIVLLIGVLTVGWQVRNAAVQNPANILRQE